MSCEQISDVEQFNEESNDSVGVTSMRQLALSSFGSEHENPQIRGNQSTSEVFVKAVEVPELEKVAKAGDGAANGEDLLKVLQSLKRKKGKKPTSQKKLKKTHEGYGTNYQRPPPRPKLHPRWYPQPKCAHIQDLFLPKKTAVPHSRRSKRKRTAVRPSHLKAGPIINNVSTALEKFKRKREKFLIYLQQLQDELTELNLPSLSKEDMFPKIKKKGKKERSESKQLMTMKSKKVPKKKKLGNKKLCKKKNSDKKPLVIESVIHLSSDSSVFSFTDSENMY